jgi:hypothetical protein
MRDGTCARTASELRQKTEIRVGYLPATSGRQIFIQEGVSSNIDYGEAMMMVVFGKKMVLYAKR